MREITEKKERELRVQKLLKVREDDNEPTESMKKIMNMEKNKNRI